MNGVYKFFIPLASAVVFSACGGGSDSADFDSFNNSTNGQSSEQANLNKNSDIAIVKAKLVDKDGNEITQNNRYEANSHILINLTIKNIGQEATPNVKEVVYCDGLSGYTSCDKVNISKLNISLKPGEERTFTFDTKEVLENSYDGKKFSFSINRDDKNSEYDDIDKNSLFEELNKNNNSVENLPIYVYQTDIELSDIAMRLNDAIDIDENRAFSIQNDNKDGNKLYLCYKLKNVGEHNFYAWNITSDAITYNTEAFGNSLKSFVGNDVNLTPNQETDWMCAYIELPQSNLYTGTYTFETKFSFANDINSDNNSKSMNYEIKE